MGQLLTHKLDAGFLARAEQCECYCVVIATFDPRSGSGTVADCVMPPVHAKGLLDKLVSGGNFSMRAKKPGSRI